MNKKIIRLLAAVLALAMLLSGCAAGGQTDTANNGSTTANKSDTAPELASKFVYTAKYYNAPETANYVSTSCMVDGAMYLAVSQEGEEKTYTDEASGESYQYYDYGYQLYKMDLSDGTTAPVGALISQSQEQSADGWSISQNLYGLDVGKDGTVWMFLNQSRSRLNLPENFDAETDNSYNYYEDGGTVLQAIQLGADGSVLNTLTLDPGEATKDPEGYNSFYPQNTLVLADGSFACSSDQKVYIWNADGTLSGTLDNDSYRELQRYDADTVGIIGYGDNGMEFQTLDTAAKSWGKTIKLPSSAWNLLPGDDSYDCYYYDNTGLYGYIAQSDTTDKLVDWLACDMDSDAVDHCYAMADGRVCVVLRDTGRGSYTIGGMSITQSSSAEALGEAEASAYQVAVLTPTDASSVTEKTELTLACLYMSSTLRSRVLKFNRTSDKYRINVRDYSEYNTGDDYTAGLTKLNTEIISGNVPDMIAVNSLPLAQYVAKGIVEELGQYIDNDPELSRDQLMTQVLDAMEIDGGLYSITDSFSISTAVGLKQAVSGYDKWTTDAAKDALGKLREDASYFNVGYTKSDVLTQCVNRSANDFVDWQTGKCSFDSADFMGLLEFANSFPAEFDYTKFDYSDYVNDATRIRDGQQLIAPAYISSFDDLQYYEAVFKGDDAYVGWPTGSGAGGSVFETGTSVAMTARCADKDAAWQFMRTMLLDTVTDDIWSFPINRTLFDKAAEAAMTPEYETDENGDFVLDENGEKIERDRGGMSMDNSEVVYFYAVTQQQYDKLMALMDTVTSTSSWDTNISNIITEEASAYFAGEKSVQDTAAAINNRVGLYVAEQK